MILLNFRGGGATRKTAPDSDLTISHSSAKDNLSPKPLKKTCLRSFYENCCVILNLIQNLSMLIGTDSGSEAGMTVSSHVYPSCHSELDSESINVDRNRLRLGGRSEEVSRMSRTTSSHSDFRLSLSMPVNSLRYFWQQKSRKAAFTLAEVLITLGIIGIVAAMTLPSLIGNYQEKQWKVAYKKAYSSMSQAFMRMQANDEVLDMSGSLNEYGELRAPTAGENFKTMSKYFNTIKTCFDNNADECWVCEEGQAGYISGAAPDWLGCNKNNYAFVDYSGMGWYLYSNNEWPVIVDVNGIRRPNRLGKDRFVLKFALNNTNETYMEEANTIQPWDDKFSKERWCPQGNCLYKTWLLE